MILIKIILESLLDSYNKGKYKKYVHTLGSK